MAASPPPREINPMDVGWAPSAGTVDETALAGPEHLDPAYVAGYDRKAAFDPADDLAVLRARGLGPGSTLIDLGSGTGTFALAAAPHCKRVGGSPSLRRMAGLLVRGGTLRLRDLVYSFSADEAEAGIRRWIDATAAGDATAGWTREELETHVREEHSAFTWLLEPMLARAGFEVVDSACAPIGAYADLTCLRS